MFRVTRLNLVICKANSNSSVKSSDFIEVQTDSDEGGKGGIVIPFHAQILTKFTRHVLNQSLSEKPQGNEIFTTKHK